LKAITYKINTSNTTLIFITLPKDATVSESHTEAFIFNSQVSKNIFC